MFDCNFHTVVWFKEFLFNTNNLYRILWFKITTPI